MSEEPSDKPPEPAVVRSEELRIAEALLFASQAPVAARTVARHLPPDCDVEAVLRRLSDEYARTGINIVKVGGKWQARTAGDLAFLFSRQRPPRRKLSKAAVETLAIVAYHQPVTRAEIETLRDVSLCNLDVLIEAGWVRPRGRRRSPGRPMTYGTTEAFLTHFGFESLRDLPPLRDPSTITLDPGVLMDAGLSSLLSDEPVEELDLDGLTPPAADD